MMNGKSISSSDLRKILIVWCIVAAVAIAGVAALRLYSVQLIERIQKSNRNPAIVGGSYQREGERYMARALERVQALKDSGQNPVLPADDPDVQKSLDLLQRAYALQPYNAGLLTTISDLYALTGDSTRQMEYQARFYLVRENKNRKPEAALNLYEKALELDPGNPVYLRGKAHSLTELGRLDDAQAILEPLAQSPDPDAETCFLMGQVMFMKKDTAATIHWFERAVAAKPDYGDAIRRLGQVYTWTNQPAKCIEALERALPLLPNDSNLLHLLGIAHKDLGELDKAQRRLLQAYKLNPRSIPLLEDIIIVYGRQGNAAAVRFYTNKALDIDPKFVASKIETGAQP